MSVVAPNPGQSPSGNRVRPVVVEAQRVLLTSLAAIRSHMEDASVNEIMINSPDAIFVERQGRIDRLNVRLSDAQLESCLHAIMRINSKEVSPIMDADLDGLRVAAALPPVAIHGPMMAIRKHASRRFKLEEYVASGAFTPVDITVLEGANAGIAEKRHMEERAAHGRQGLADFLRWMVRAHKNVLVVGGTSSGKTTFISSLLEEIPHEERIITCEDTHELTLDHPNLVQLKSLPNNDPSRTITIRDLIKLCLRARPDRIIVGEIRGPEAYDFLDSMNTGHSGSLCTLHADSAFLGLRRLESLIRMSPTAANLPIRDMRAEIASAIHYVVFQRKLAGVRGPQEVLALEGVDDNGDYVSRLIYNRIGDSHA